MNATGAEDKILEASRSCIEKGGGQKDSDSSLADAHNFIAITLKVAAYTSKHSVTHAKLSRLTPQNPPTKTTLRNSFNGLDDFKRPSTPPSKPFAFPTANRFMDAFHTGDGLLQTENWPLASRASRRPQNSTQTTKRTIQRRNVCNARAFLEMPQTSTKSSTPISQSSGPAGPVTAHPIPQAVGPLGRSSKECCPNRAGGLSMAVTVAVSPNP